MSDTELIALILQSGLPTHELLQLSTQLLAQAGSLRGLMSWQPADFRRLRGIGQAKARQLTAVVEIARRMMKPEEAPPPMLSRPELVAQYMSPIVAGLEVEKFWVACLNRKNRLKKLVEVRVIDEHHGWVTRCWVRHSLTQHAGHRYWYVSNTMLPNLTPTQFNQLAAALDLAIKVADSANPRNRESFRLMHRLLRLKLRVLVLRDRKANPRIK